MMKMSEPSRSNQGLENFERDLDLNPQGLLLLTMAHPLSGQQIFFPKTFLTPEF